MAAMVKTYLLLCVVGLFTTFFVIFITYGENRRLKPIPSKIRMINPANNSTGQTNFDPFQFQHAIPIINEDKNSKNAATSEQQQHKIRGINEQLKSQRILQNKKEELTGDSRYVNIANKDRNDALYQNMDVISKKVPIFNDTDVKTYPPQMQQREPANVFPEQKNLIDEFHKFINEETDAKPVLTKSDQPAAVGDANNRVLPADDYTRSCKPHDDIALLKTHKCSSSTLQNILYRWGDTNNLSFVLPKGGMPYLGSPALFDKRFAIESADGVYNILANHARFSDKGMAAALPPDTIYITILRNPATQYESLYNYYRHQTRYGADLSRFLGNPKLYFQKEPLSTHIVGRNSMLFDLGLDARYMEGTDDKVSRWIQMLDRKFKLVLIAEYFSESLILLKDLLCWSMDDIVFLNQNARSPSSVRKLTPMLQQGILKWNSGDAKLYHYFNQTLWQKIEAYGVDKMKRDVEFLKMKNEALTKDCVQSTLKFGDPRMWYPPGVKMESFKVNPNAQNKELCDRITRPELTYMKLLADKQRQRNSAILQTNGIHKVVKRDVPVGGPEGDVRHHDNIQSKLYRRKPHQLLKRNADYNKPKHRAPN